MKRAGFIVVALSASALMLAAQSSSHASDQSSASSHAAAQASAHPAGPAEANQRAVEIVNTANLGEIKAGDYMQRHGASAGVRQYAQELTRDHQNAENKLEATMGQSVVSDTDASMQMDGQREMQQLQSASGSAADREFLQDEINDHRNVIHQLQQLEPNITDPKVKSYVQSVIPTLQKHLNDARKAESSR